MLPSLVLLSSVLSVQSQSPLNNFSVHFDGTATTFSWISTELSNSTDKIHFTLEEYHHDHWDHVYSVDFSVNTTHHTMVLEPYADFKACVSAFNDTWSSDPVCLRFTVSSGTPTASNVDIDIINTTMVHAFWNMHGDSYLCHLSNSTHNLTYTSNESFVMFRDLSPNSSYTLRVCAVNRLNATHVHHHNDDETTVSWKMPLGAPPVPETPHVYVSPEKVEIRVSLTPVSDENGFIGHYILHVDTHRDHDGEHVHKDFGIHLERFTENVTLNMSDYMHLDNDTSYRFVVEAQNAAMLYTSSNASKCVTLGDEEPHCHHEDTNEKTKRSSYAGYIVSICALTMLLTGVVVISVMFVRHRYKKYKENQNNTVPYGWHSKSLTSFTNPAFGTSPTSPTSTHDIYEDDINSDTIPTDANGNYDVSDYVDV